MGFLQNCFSSQNTFLSTALFKKEKKKKENVYVKKRTQNTTRTAQIPQ